MNVKGTNNNWDSTNVKLRFKLQTSGKGIPNSFNGYFFSVSMATFGQYAYSMSQGTQSLLPTMDCLDDQKNIENIIIQLAGCSDQK